MRIGKGLEPLLKRAALRSVRRRGNSIVPPVDRTLIRRIMIYRPERFGDMLATTPLVRALRAELPEASIHLWTSEQGRELLAAEPGVDHIELIAGKSSDRTLASRTDPFDLVIDLRMRDSVNALLTCDTAARDGLLIGWGKDQLCSYYDWAPACGDSDHYAITHALGIMALFDADVQQPPDCLPTFTDAEQSTAAKVLRDIETVVMLNLSAGDRNRRLPEGYWQYLIQHLRTKCELEVLLNALGDDRLEAEQMTAQSNANVRLLPDSLTFREVSCVVSRLQLLISPDTSLVHVAAAAQVPTVAMYVARTDPRMSWIPPFDHVQALVAPAESIASIGADRIADAADALLSVAKRGAASR